MWEDIKNTLRKHNNGVLRDAREEQHVQSSNQLSYLREAQEHLLTVDCVLGPLRRTPHLIVK